MHRVGSWLSRVPVWVCLVTLVAVSLLPLVMQWWPAIYNDCARETLPAMIATARVFQQGDTIPLWDFCTFSGAKPPYAENKLLIFYPPMYPFFLLADTEDTAQSHVMLLLLPFALHVTWAALGAYAFGRVVLKLHPAGSFLSGLMYGLSPEMGFQLITPQIAILLSYLPWCLLALSQFMETGSLRWWLAGTLFVALLGSVGNPNYLVRAYFVISLIVTLLWVLMLRDAWSVPPDNTPVAGESLGVGNRQWFAARFLGVIAIFIMSIGLNGASWAGMIEGALWIKDAYPMTAESVASFRIDSSMPPPNVVTLWIPGFFGVVAGRHAWGIGVTQQMDTETALTGGMFVMVAVVGAMFQWLRRRPNNHHKRVLRRWTAIATIILFGSLFTMMGRFTPVFGWLCGVLPWFFKFPHPVYYRFAQCWSIAILAGIGVSSLLSLPPDATSKTSPSKASKTWLRAAIVCVIAGLAAALSALSSPTHFESHTMRNFETLTLFREWGWFLSGPVTYFAIASLFLVLLFAFRNTRNRGRWIALGAIAETGFLAWCIFYVDSASDQVRRFPDYASTTDEVRIRTFQDDPRHEFVSAISKLTKQRRTRFASNLPSLDNFAWYIDGRALRGFSGKPLMPWYDDMLNGMQLGNTEWLFHNMNVEYYIAPDWGYGAQDTQSVIAVLKKTGLAIYKLPGPIPYAYTQDCVVALDTNAQLDRLYSTDLRRAVFVDPKLAAKLPATDGVNSGPATAEDERRFSTLQRINVIESIDQSRGNQTTIKADIKTPAMLVVVECWHSGWKAYIDGRPAPVYRVNYLQQGVWLERGQHTIEFRFRPRAYFYGIIVSALFACIFGLMLLKELLELLRRKKLNCK